VGVLLLALASKLEQVVKLNKLPRRVEFLLSSHFPESFCGVTSDGIAYQHTSVHRKSPAKITGSSGFKGGV
jgi:hypothetical protein